MRGLQALRQALPLGQQLAQAASAALGGGSAAALLGLARQFSSSAATANPLGPPAFVFDIDGVLIRGRHTLPQAKRALARLYTPDGSRPRYPVAFLTNGGGVTERVKAHQLSEWLGVHVDESQVVLSHTPFRQLAAKFAHEPVLVAGRGQVREVARHYGFRHVVTTHQLTRAMPAAVPFHEDQGLFPGQDLPVYTRELKYGSPQHPIRAIMVFTDPSDWYRDLQLMTDVILSRGMPGCWPPPAGAPPVEVFFSNPDMLWANEFTAPRFGQGAFSTCLEALHFKLTGEPLPHAHHFGKPHAAPYLLIERLLLQQAQQLGIDVPEPAEEAALAAAEAGRVVSSSSSSGSDEAGSSGGGSGSSSSSARSGSAHRVHTPLPFSSIYAVGDNPAADVRGANAAGAPWVSVLVAKTGVATENSPADPAQVVVDDVEAAVEAGLHRARNAKWHSMR